MKQHITVEQLNELSLKGKSNLMKWLNTRDSELTEDDSDDAYTQEAFLSIGQMIEFLEMDSLGDLVISVSTYRETAKNAGGLGGDYCQVKKNSLVIGSSPELCDALWEAVKNVLEETN